jgi:hypothetical protein
MERRSGIPLFRRGCLAPDRIAGLGPRARHCPCRTGAGLRRHGAAVHARWQARRRPGGSDRGRGVRPRTIPGPDGRRGCARARWAQRAGHGQRDKRVSIGWYDRQEQSAYEFGVPRAQTKTKTERRHVNSAFLMCGGAGGCQRDSMRYRPTTPAQFRHLLE